MSEKISGAISKFSKWLVLRMELKYKDALEKINDPIQVCELAINHQKSLLTIHLRHQVIQLVLLFAGLASAVLTVLGFLN